MPSPETLFGLLSDARFLIGCIPDATDLRALSTDEAHCSVQPDFSFVRGKLAVTLRVVDRQPPVSVKFLLGHKGIGSSAEIESTLQLEPQGTGTKVTWQAVISRLSALLKLVPHGLVRGAAQKVTEEIWTHIEKRVAESTPG